MVGFAGLHLLVVFVCWCVRSDCVGISYRHVRVSPPVTNYDRCVQFGSASVCLGMQFGADWRQPESGNDSLCAVWVCLVMLGSAWGCSLGPIGDNLNQGDILCLFGFVWGCLGLLGGAVLVRLGTT